MSYQRRTAVAAGEIRAHLGRTRQTLKDLSAATGISLPTLNRRLHVQSAFTIDELDVIAKHFGVEVTDLLRPPHMTEVAS